MTPIVVITGIFFIIGITVGVITVIAMSALRRDGRDGPGDWPDGTPTEKNQWWQARDGE